MPRRSRVEVEERACAHCGRVVPASRGDSPCCSDTCEVKHLREQVAAKDQRIERLSRKKGPVKCLGRVNWTTCAQEWYLKDSYDAKRRANELRKLGFKVEATTIGEMPVRAEGRVDMVKVTILTAWRERRWDSVPPAPAQFVDGIRGNGRRQ